MRHLELVCPAGGWEALQAAVEYGADSVYLGGMAFGARAAAENFDDQKLIDAVSYAHRYGVRILLTVNTLILEQEMPRALAMIDAIHTAGADGLIVQDLGLVRKIRQRYPRAPLHASTQMAIHNVAGAQALAKEGFRRVVLARECSLQDMQSIAKAVPLELEAFCHGALCVCVSGACLMSSVIGGRSGNRGRCAQPCRLPYTLMQAGAAKKQGYLLSPRDLCALPILEKMAEAGITAFKIEGRLKRPGYVATMTKIYREALDSIERSGGYTPLAGDLQRLAEVYARGGRFTTGYAPGLPSHASLMSHETPSYPELSQEESMPSPYIRERPLANAHITLRVGEPPVLRMNWNGHEVAARGDAPLPRAQKQPVTRESILRSLSKTGDTPFALGEVQGEWGDAFISVSALNALRRSCLAQLEECLMKDRTPAWAADPPENRETVALPEFPREKADRLWVWTPDIRRGEAALRSGADGIYWAPEHWAHGPDDLTRLDAWRKQGRKVYLAMPLLLREDDFAVAARFAIETREHWDGILAPNLGMIQWAQREGLPVVGDIALNVTNPQTRDFYLEQGLERVTLSPELNASQIRDCSKGQEGRCEAVVQGRLPLMTLSHCPLRASTEGEEEGCRACSGHLLILRDRKGVEFPVRRTRLSQCQQTLFNSVPLSLEAHWGKLPPMGNWRVYLLDESPEDCRRIVETYRKLLDGEDIPVCAEGRQQAVTSGHWFRGVQ